MSYIPAIIQEKINELQTLCNPDKVVVCNGSEQEYESFLAELVKKGVATPLKGKGQYYFRSDPKDVARVEKATFICSKTKEEAGPLNNWTDPSQMKQRLQKLFQGCMKGRVMYIIPYMMGHPDSPLSKVGIEVTDSLYVCVNMYIMARMGKEALKKIEETKEYVFGLHSVGYPLDNREDVFWPCNEEKVIAHFPEDKEIYSYGSGYGGNALLGKKCFALRIASVMAKSQGWLAEHMLIIGLTNPEGEKKYIAAAFPSQCGKTNLAMLESNMPGWKVTCVGDDIAWLKFKEDGKLYAINPENGFFGVAPGTSEKTNPIAMDMIKKDTLFTNVALSGDRVWWEGLDGDVPDNLMTWKGQQYEKGANDPASHPNARFTTPIRRCKSIDESVNKGKEVEIEAIVFGGRRSDVSPLVMESLSYEMGVMYGAALCSEKTAAAEGVVGELRNDPFAMRPFCGYHISSYFNHWLSMNKDKKRKMPKIFSVNWFRKNGQGKYIWPGFKENMIVLSWIFQAIDGKASKKKTSLGYLPKNLPVDQLNIDSSELEQIVSFTDEQIESEFDRYEKFFESVASQTEENAIAKVLKRYKEKHVKRS